MPDITMCSAVSCPRSKTCLRHQDSGTVPSPYAQAYADLTSPSLNGCGYYWYKGWIEVDKLNNKEN